MRKWLLFTSLCCLTAATAQNKLVFEALRFGTPINYLSDSAVRKDFLNMVSALTMKHLHMPLTDTGHVQFVDISKQPAGPVSFDIRNADTSTLYLFLNISEYDPRVFLADAPDGADTILQKEAPRTVFRISFTLVNAAKAIRQQEWIDVIVSHNKSAGVGNESPLLFLLPRTFVEVMRNVLDKLLDPANTISKLGLAVAPVYMADNYIMPKITNMPRTQVTAQRDMSAFNYGGRSQLLRQVEPLYEEVMYKGKHPKKYSDSLLNAIRETPNAAGYDFVLLMQECRDVFNDKNYLIQLVTKVDPYASYQTGGNLFTGFLPGKMHYLLGDRDTIASFSITRNLPAPDKIQYPSKLYNGYDTATLLQVNNIKVEWPVTYNYYISGRIAGHNFEIYCAGAGNKVKEIYLDSKLVCIGQGRFKPDVFVIFDATLQPILFNQLLLIGFNRFLE